MSAGFQGGGPIAAGRVVAGKFLLEARLSQGGMGAVWRAQHTALRTPCAVKFLHQGVAESAAMRARFEREAIAAAQLRSANVVNILDHGVWEGVPYIAMELLEGEDLAHRLHRAKRLAPRETAQVIAQVARALQKAHAAGLVHRDLKPANIFLVRDDDLEIAKVLDFGVAKVERGTDVDGMTKTGAVLGTPYYMSPEQSQGAKNLDHRSDLWSLAVVAYQCLTGVLPFYSEAIGDLFMRIIVHPLPVPSQVAPVPPGFDAWWAKAAARDPAARFQTARELSDALGLALGITTGDVPIAGMITDARMTAAVPPAQPPANAPETVTLSGTIAMAPPTPPQLYTPATPVGAALTPPPVLPAVAAAPAAATPGRGLVVAVAMGCVAVLGLGAFVALRASSSRAAPAASTEAPVTSTPAPLVAPEPTPAAPSAVPAPTVDLATASASAPPAPTPPPVKVQAALPAPKPLPSPPPPPAPPKKKNLFNDRN